MSVTLRPGNKFYHFRFMHGGRLYQGSTKQTNQRRAELFEAGLITKVMAGDGDYLLQKKDPPTLGKFAEQFMEHVDARYAAKSYKLNTRLMYVNGCMQLAKTRVWKMPINQITRPVAVELQFSGGPWNANRALTTLRKILSYAEELGVIRVAPRIDKRRAKGRLRVFEPWQEHLVLDHAPPALRGVLTIMFDCGMRVQEAASVRWEHIRWDKDQVLVPDGKTENASRVTLLTQRMRDMFAEARKRNEKRKRGDSPYVFPSPRSKNGHVSSFNKLWERTVERANAAAQKRGRPKLPEDLVPYSARHTFATEYYRITRDIAKLSRLLGHSDIQTTMIYMHIVEGGETSSVMDRANERKIEIVRRRA